jgi:hypothetical protein
MRLAIRNPRRRAVVLVAASLALVGCGQGPTITTGSPAAPAVDTASATPPPDIASPRDCGNVSPTAREKHGLELEGRMRDGQPFYALFDGARSGIDARDHLTTFFRLPGARVLRVTLVGPGDRLVRVAGMRPGLPSFRWDRPGDPWTGTLTFSRPGCWRIYVHRSGDDGEIWLHVG